MRKQISLAACVSFLICVPLTLAHSDAAATTYGAISGKVIAEDTGQGVGGLSVLAVVLSPGSRVHHYADTDANGIYVLKDLEPGSYAVSFNAPDSVYLFDGAALTVPLPAGKNVVNGNCVLRLGGSVSGAVYDSDGVTPVTNVWVSALAEGSQPGTGTGFKATLTAGDGRFLLRGLPQSDNCTVQVRVPGLAVQSQTVRITTASTTPDVNFLLKRDDITGVGGQVTSSADGAPIAGAEIVLRDIPGNDIGNTYTGATGRYSITAVPPGVYSATAYWPTGEFAGLHREGITITSGTQVPLDFQFNAPSPQSQSAGTGVFDGPPMSVLPDPFYPYPDPKFHGCSPSERDLITRAFNGIKQLIKFDPCLSPAMRNKLKEKLTEGIRFFCVSSADNNACPDLWGFTYDGVTDVYLCRDLSLSDITPEWCLESTILHELTHAVGNDEMPARKCDKACYDKCSAVGKEPWYNQFPPGCTCD